MLRATLDRGESSTTGTPLLTDLGTSRSLGMRATIRSEIARSIS
jgi:hypothetical protein